MKANLPILLLVLAISVTSCSDNNVAEKPKDGQWPSIEAIYSKKPVKVDGLLDEEIWSKAKVYSLAVAKNLQSSRPLAEAGSVQLAWDEEYFYLAAKFKDSDIVAEGKKDELHHYRLGDVCELFLKPADSSWYWEFYVTPRGKKSSFWFPGRGRLGLPSCFEYSCGLKVGAHVVGTTNNWRDKDGYWTAEMAMPIKDLTAHGDKFAPGDDWRILVGRYNYSIYLDHKGPELSSAPQLSAANYHMLEEYAKLVLVN